MFYHTHVYTHLTIPPNPFLSLNLHLPVGSSLKITAWLPLPWTLRRSLATHGIAHSTRTSHIRNSSPLTFHPDISHPEFFSADIPPGYLTSGILLRRHSTRISHIRNSSLPTFHPDISHSEFSPPTFHSDISHPKFSFADIPPGYLVSGILLRRRSTFPGYLASRILSGRRSTFFFILRAFS